MIEYLKEIIRPLVSILPSRRGYAKTFKDKSGDKNKNNKLMTLAKCADMLLKKYKTSWTKIEGLQNIELDTLPVYDDRY